MEESRRQVSAGDRGTVLVGMAGGGAGLGLFFGIMGPALLLGLWDDLQGWCPRYHLLLAGPFQGKAALFADRLPWGAPVALHGHWVMGRAWATAPPA